MKFKLDNKGVSLAMMIGLMLLLVAITTTINEMVIRALRASHQIEAADRAYFAAEAGVEDALYELSAHTAGYETAPLGDAGVRNADFTETAAWHNEWQIANKGLNTCGDMDPWEDDYYPSYCGRVHEGEKLVINLFSDDALTGGIATNQINETTTDIHTLDVTEITIKFRLPLSVVDDNANTFFDLDPLKIDNDGDYDTVTGLGLNEDGHVDFGYALNSCPYSGGVKISDNDCDGREDEDSRHDPVLLWKLIDDDGHSFQPLRGCIHDDPHSSHLGQPNANICETSFRQENFEIEASFSHTDYGLDQDGTPPILLGDFLTAYGSGSSTLQMEIIVVAPLEHIDRKTFTKINIPYLEYGMNYTETNGDLIPSTYFSIKSDGYYQDFKQSITTNVVPRATTRLLDLTIIQQ